jgi:long-chain fatty acid transport protein
VILALALQAQAAGFLTSEGGVLATGRGNAYVAGADDLSAQGWNPAALTRLDSSVQLQLAGVHQRVAFDRLDETDLSFPEVRNGAPPMLVPGLAGATSFGRSDMTLAFGFYSPYAPLWSYPADGPQRFTSVDSTVLSGNVGPSLAWRFADRLSVGLGAAWTFLSIQQTLVSHVSPLSFSATDDPSYDVSTSISAQDLLEFTWNAGLLYEDPRDRFALGAGYTPAVHFEPRGSMGVDFSNNTYYLGDGNFGKVITVAQAEDGDVGLEVALPHQVRVGALVRPRESWEIELDLVWQGWSILDGLVVDDLALDIETELPEDVTVTGTVGLPLELQDAWSARLGTEAALGERFEGRAGVFFESSAASRENRSVLMPDGNKLGYGLGASFQARPRLALDLGWSQSFVPRHEIETTWVYQVQIDPQSGQVGAGKPVGKGSLAVMNSALALGLRFTPGAR